MKKLLSLFLILATFMVLAPAANALPFLTYGDNSLYYTNREVVFRNDGQGNYYELDYSDPNNLPELQVGDIFVGILNVQNIDDSGTGGTHWWSNGSDQLSGIFAQEITNISALPAPLGSYTLRLDLGVASTDTFTTINGDTFTTGLSGNEVLKMYTDDSTIFNSNGTIVEDIADATDGNEWISLGIDKPTDYAFTYISPQGTGLDEFVGKSWLGFSVLNFVYPSTIFPGAIDPEVGVLVDFYANSELEGHDNYLSGDSPWVFESNDPAFLNAVPEPATFALFGIGLILLSGFARRKTA
jgi:hypothetical protein